MIAAAATTIDVDDTLAIVVVIVSVITGLGGVAATVFSYGRVKAVEGTLQLLRDENDALTSAYEGMRDRAAVERVSCAEQIAELRGRIDLLTQQFTHSIAAGVVAAVREVGAVATPNATPHHRTNQGDTR